MLDLKVTKQKLAKVAKNYQLLFVVLFGSQVTGRTHQESDVDLAFYSARIFSPGELAKLQLKLSQALGVKNLELLDLKHAPPFLLQQIALHSIPLYIKDHLFFSQFKIYALKRFMEAKPLLKLREKSLNNFLQKYGQ